MQKVIERVSRPGDASPFLPSTAYLVIPDSVMSKAGWRDDERVELTVTGKGKVVATPVRQR